ncbi:MAG: hypothetical protein IPN71_07295 [Fibrobacteres bacterium]|nr:hypothetical protein [Fibrobacterota bacterium]
MLAGFLREADMLRYADGARLAGYLLEVRPTAAGCPRSPAGRWRHGAQEWPDRTGVVVGGLPALGWLAWRARRRVPRMLLPGLPKDSSPAQPET